MDGSRRKRRTWTCPHCGAEFLAGRLACPECGSDRDTGWKSQEEIDYESVELPEEDGPPQERGVPLPWRLVAVLLLGIILLGLLLLGRWL